MIGSLTLVLALQFCLFRLLPGDPSTAVLSDGMTRDTQAALRHLWGLDRPLDQQFFIYVRNLLRLELGVSFFHNAPVWEILGGKLSNTIALMVGSVSLGSGAGIFLGILAATRRRGAADVSLLLCGTLARATPVFVSGILAILLFASGLGWLPQGGIQTIGADQITGWRRFLALDFFHHLLLPMTICSLHYFATPFFLMRSTLVEQLGAEYVTAARAKGLPPLVVLLRHAGRNALNPVVTTVALSFGFAVGGQVVVETVFRWPGIGSELVAATLRRDYPMMQSAYFLISAVVLLANFLADCAYVLLDPRIRYASAL